MDLDSGCSTDLAGASCESVDKIFYRSGTAVTLTPTQYFVRSDFTDAGGAQLSDHFPTGAVFTVPEPAAGPLAALIGLAALARRRAPVGSPR
jgi:uncharacterized protein (TIGR03382 family)